jgi:hypothetical protein
LQPVLVRPKGKKFETVCGERKFRACALAGLETIPAMILNELTEEILELVNGDGISMTAALELCKYKCGRTVGYLRKTPVRQTDGLLRRLAQPDGKGFCPTP